MKLDNFIHWSRVRGGVNVVARARSPNRDKAFKMWKESRGSLKLKEIAKQLGVSDSQIRKWKNLDKWDDKLKVTLPNSNSNVTNRNKVGAPKGNKNAVGNKGGAPVGNKNATGNDGGAPKRNTNAIKHGFFSRIFPDDEETHSIIEEISIKSPLDIIWENIVIQYTAIARAQRIMFVKDQGDHIQLIKKDSSGDSGSFTEYEIQTATDRQANFLQAQSRAISSLQKLIDQYESMANDEQKLKVEKLKAEIDKIKGPDESDLNISIKVDYGDEP